MSLVAAVFGLLIIAAGALGVVSPSRVLALVARSQSQRGLYVLAAIRVVMRRSLSSCGRVAGSSLPPDFRGGRGPGRCGHTGLRRSSLSGRSQLVGAPARSRSPLVVPRCCVDWRGHRLGGRPLRSARPSGG